MADFPSFPITRDSVPQPRDGRTIDVDSDGVAHVRKLYADKADFPSVTLPRLDSTQVTSLFAHYSANLLATFNFFYPGDGLTYVVKYAKAPQLVDKPKGARATYRVAFVAGA